MKETARLPQRIWNRGLMGISLALSLAGLSLEAATTTLVNENFDSYTGAAANLDDVSDADPDSARLVITDDNPQGSPDGSGVQLVGWTAQSGTQSLLVRSGSEAILQITNALSGSKYQLDFNLQVVKGTGDRNFYIIVRAEGNDTNGEDFMAYRSDRGTSGSIFYYDGIAPGGGWQDIGVQHIEGQWQHHRFVFDMRTLTFDLYIDDMNTPVVQGGDISRSGAAVPTAIILRNEGNSPDDGYYAIDDLTLTVEDATSLASTFTEGFENYPAAAAGGLDDADPLGPWITNEADGTGDAKPINPGKVQVVDSSVVAPHSGQKSLKLEGGQRAGVSYAWGEAPQQDVQVTWWARVPASVAGTTANYLRMSIYGVEDGRADQGDSALLGYGSRDGTTGDETSLTIYTTAWQDTMADYTPDTWEEYRFISHVEQGTYSIIKNPSSANPVMVADRAPFIGGALRWGPMFMVAFSSSNGSGHPPVYVDDIEVRAVTTNPEDLPEPYSAELTGTRFTNVFTLKPGGAVGNVAVDPRDNTTIYFTVDSTSGAIYRAVKTAPGTWTMDETPVVTGLDRPSGLVIDSEGTLWWTHDYTQRLMRLKAPYDGSPEVIIENFGPETTDDDPIDLTIAPPSFVVNGVTNLIVVADRGSDGDANNALYRLDPNTIEPGQMSYVDYLVEPTASDLGGGNLNAIASLPESGEVVTISADAYIVAVNADGLIRPIYPTVLYADIFAPASPQAVAVDPTTGRIWIADDALSEIWSISASATAQTPDQLEAQFPLMDGARDDQKIDFHDPGMAFSPDGAFLVVTDTSVSNGGGRLIVFHNEETPAVGSFAITKASRNAGGFELQWEAVSGVKYVVERSAQLGAQASFQEISGELTGGMFTDANPPAGRAFYRVIARP